MTWPAPDLPIDFTNATPQQDAHPDAHNATNLTLNDNYRPEIIRLGSAVNTAQETADQGVADAAQAVVTANAYTDENVIEWHRVAASPTIDRNTNVGFSTQVQAPTIVATKNGTALVTATLDVQLINVGTGTPSPFAARIVIGSSAAGGEIVWQPQGETVGARMTLSRTWLVPRNAGPGFNVGLQAGQAAAAGGYKILADHTEIAVLFVG